MSVLYVNEQDTVVGIEGGHFVVKEKDGSTRKIPKETLESITLFGNVTITTQCCRECLTNGIPINFFSTRGSYFGKLSSTMHEKGDRLRCQVLAMEDRFFKLEMAKRCINAKLLNQIVLLRRYARNNDNNISDQIMRIELA